MAEESKGNNIKISNIDSLLKYQELIKKYDDIRQEMNKDKLMIVMNQLKQRFDDTVKKLNLIETTRKKSSEDLNRIKFELDENYKTNSETTYNEESDKETLIEISKRVDAQIMGLNLILQNLEEHKKSFSGDAKDFAANTALKEQVYQKFNELKPMYEKKSKFFAHQLNSAKQEIVSFEENINKNDLVLFNKIYEQTKRRTPVLIKYTGERQGDVYCPACRVELDPLARVQLLNEGNSIICANCNRLIFI